jgi:hypothetical protein
LRSRPCASASNACQHAAVILIIARLQVVDTHDGKWREQGDAIVGAVDCLAHNALHLTGWQSEANLHTIEFPIINKAIHWCLKKQIKIKIKVRRGKAKQ